MSADDDPMRALTRALFTDPDAPSAAEPADQPPTPGNHVPNEGNNPTISDPHAEMREFIRGLFERTD